MAQNKNEEKIVQAKAPANGWYRSSDGKIFAVLPGTGWLKAAPPKTENGVRVLAYEAPEYQYNGILVPGPVISFYFQPPIKGGASAEKVARALGSDIKGLFPGLIEQEAKVVTLPGGSEAFSWIAVSSSTISGCLLSVGVVSVAEGEHSASLAVIWVIPVINGKPAPNEFLSVLNLYAAVLRVGNKTIPLTKPSSPTNPLQGLFAAKLSSDANAWQAIYFDPSGLCVDGWFPGGDLDGYIQTAAGGLCTYELKDGALRLDFKNRGQTLVLKATLTNKSLILSGDKGTQEFFKLEAPSMEKLEGVFSRYWSYKTKDSSGTTREGSGVDSIEFNREGRFAWVKDNQTSASQSDSSVLPPSEEYYFSGAFAATKTQDPFGNISTLRTQLGNENRVGTYELSGASLLLRDQSGKASAHTIYYLLDPPTQKITKIFVDGFPHSASSSF